MKIKSIIIISNIATFAFVHNKFRFISRYPGGWARLTAYCLGVFFNAPFFVAHIANRESPDNAYIISFIASGIGTALGWMLDDVI